MDKSFSNRKEKEASMTTLGMELTNICHLTFVVN